MLLILFFRVYEEGKEGREGKERRRGAYVLVFQVDDNFFFIRVRWFFKVVGLWQGLSVGCLRVFFVFSWDSRFINRCFLMRFKGGQVEVVLACFIRSVVFRRVVFEEVGAIQGFCSRYQVLGVEFWVRKVGKYIRCRLRVGVFRSQWVVLGIVIFFFDIECNLRDYMQKILVIK